MSEKIKENIKAYYIGSDIDKVLDYIQQKENIIKEVREQLEKANEWVLGVGLKAILLEILDKAEE